MTPQAMHKSKAEKLATKIWEDAGKHFPVEPQKIAALHKIEVKLQDLEDDVSGMMVTREDGNAVIAVNEHHSKTRQRFSMAHELGHFFLHRTVSPVFVDSKKVFYRDARASEGTIRQEIEANAFAAELLMPAAEVRKRFPEKLSGTEEDEMDVSAKEFGVSVLALSIRLQRLGLLQSQDEHGV